MRTNHHAVLVAGAVALAGCYAELADDSVTMRRSLPVCDTGVTSCTFRGVPLALRTLVPIAIAGGATEFTLDLGTDFFKAETTAGPLTMHGSLVLRGATLQMTTAGASFDGIDHLEIVQMPVAGCTGACQPRIVASYDRLAGATPNPTTLTLTGTGANLLDMGGSQITIRLVASGTLPTIDWAADVTLQGKFSERATL